MDGIPWTSSKSEENHGIFGGERLGLYICAVGGALFGSMSWGAALASRKYAEEIRQSSATIEGLVKNNTSELKNAVLSLKAANTGLYGGVSLLNDVSGAMRRGWDRNVSEYRQVGDETAARLNEIAENAGKSINKSAETYMRASDRVEQAAAKLEDTHKQQDAFVGTLNTVAKESQRRRQNWHDSMEKESQKIEQVSRTLYAGQRELRGSIHGVKVATDNLTREHGGFVEGLNQLNTLQREWKGMNSENIKMINRLLSQKSALPSELMLKDVTWKKMNVSEPQRVNSSPAAKQRRANIGKHVGEDNSSEDSWHPSHQSESDSSLSGSELSFDPDADATDTLTGKVIRAPRRK